MVVATASSTIAIKRPRSKIFDPQGLLIDRNRLRKVLAPASNSRRFLRELKVPWL